MNNSIHISNLIVKKVKGTISQEEWIELETWINENPENLSAFKKATDPKNQLSKLENYSSFRNEKIWASLENELFEPKTIIFVPRNYYRYAAAILFPLIVSAGIMYFFIKKPAEISLATIDNVIKPGSQKATLILSNGGELELNEKAFDNIIEGEANISNSNKSLIYSEKSEKTGSQDLIYNELRTPRGGGYNIKLADGSEVWINAGSSLKFPVSFTDSTRQVFLEGEAYFKVSHNGKPFIVSSGNMDVRVLGTSFNISAYKDENEIKTTLVEGSVRIDLPDQGASRILAPNDQAVLTKADSKIRVEEVNTAIYTSWVNGKLEFNNESLDEVMKRLARWYDFEYEFKNTLAKEYHFTARITNEASISSILDMLEMTSNAKFEIKGKTIVVI